MKLDSQNSPAETVGGPLGGVELGFVWSVVPFPLVDVADTCEVDTTVTEADSVWETAEPIIVKCQY